MQTKNNPLHLDFPVKYGIMNMYAFIRFEVFKIAAADEFSVTLTFWFLGKMLLILFLIFLIAVITPKIAGKIDRAAEKSKKNKQEEDERLYQVRSVFEPSPDDERPLKTLFPEVQEKNNITRNEEQVNGKE